MIYARANGTTGKLALHKQKSQGRTEPVPGSSEALGSVLCAGDAGSGLQRPFSCQSRSGVGLYVKRRGVELGVQVVTVLFVLFCSCFLGSSSERRLHKHY